MDEPTQKEESDNFDDWDTYVFDTEYFKMLLGENYYDADAAACFRIVSETKQTKYLVIYNNHNGYYGHGFTFEVAGKVKEGGDL